MADPVEKYNTLLSSSKFLFIVYYRGHWCPFFIITSEREEYLAATRKSSGYQGEAIVDPKNKLVKYFKEQDLLDVAISEMKLRRYEFGVTQPAILVIGQVLEKWAIVPGMMNIGGAKDRPELEQVWENVQAKLDGRESAHAVYRTMGVWGVMWWAIFG